MSSTQIFHRFKSEGGYTPAWYDARAARGGSSSLANTVKLIHARESAHKSERASKSVSARKSEVATQVASRTLSSSLTRILLMRKLSSLIVKPSTIPASKKPRPAMWAILEKAGFGSRPTTLRNSSMLSTPISSNTTL